MPSTKADEIDLALDGMGFPRLIGLPKFDDLLPFIKQDKKRTCQDLLMVLIDGARPIHMDEWGGPVAVSVDVMAEGYNSALEMNRE